MTHFPDQLELTHVYSMLKSYDIHMMLGRKCNLGRSSKDLAVVLCSIGFSATFRFRQGMSRPPGNGMYPYEVLLQVTKQPIDV